MMNEYGKEQAQETPYYDPSTAEVPPPGHPLQKLGEYLSCVLDEDEWATAEQHLLAAWAGISAKSIPVVGEPVAYAVMFVGNDCKIKGEPHRLVGAHTATAHCVDVGTPLVLQPATSITEAELERLRKDAERYRWLRDRMVGAHFDFDDDGMVILAFEMPDTARISADCDETIDSAAAIDAALAATKEKK